MKKFVTNVLFVSMLLFAFTMNAQHVVQPPLMGWSSWNTYGFQINDSVIQAQADAMVELGFKECGYNHINIDDGFFGGRDSDGNLLIHPERFPNGLRPLVDYIHSLGLKAGIYSDAGRNTCASYWGNPKDTIGRGVGLYGHDEADFDLYFNPEKCNFDFIKIDYCGADAGNNDEGLDLNVEQRYKDIANAIKAVGRNDVTWNICRWAFPGTWACEIADSWRTTEDIYLGWESVKSIINQSLYLSAYTTYGHYNDMDMLEVGRGLTEEEDKTHFGMWCIMSSPLLIGCDMNDIKGNALSLMQNKELIALNQNTLGQQAYVVKRENGCYVLVKDAEELQDRKRAVAFYNPTNSAAAISINFSALDLAGNIKVRDLFEREDVGVKSGSMSVEVPAHGTRIYLLDAEERLERTVYEAETAWLTKYQELKNHETENTATYLDSEICSGGVKVGYLGATAENDLQWRNVYSFEGGEYVMRLSFITGDNRSFKISVNGGEPIETTVNSGGWGTVGTKDYNIVLNKGNNVIRLFAESGWLPDIDCMRLTSLNAPVVPKGDYPVVFDKEQDYTNSSRRLNSVSLNTPSGGEQTLQLPTPLKVYSLVDNGCFNAMPGEVVTPTFGFTGNWMNGFVYIDRGQDGAFEAVLNADGSIPAGSDIMAFSYAEPVLGGAGYNSLGERVTNTNVLNPPAFTIPTDLAPGFYRMRYKVDWASIDPAGRIEDGNGIIKNGGAVCDVAINVHNANGTLSVKAENGRLLAVDDTALPAEVPFGQSLALKIVPDEGYALDYVELRHGHNLDGENVLHGVQQYAVSSVPAFLLKGDVLTIPAEFIDGDVELRAVFVESIETGVAGEYSLAFEKEAARVGGAAAVLSLKAGATSWTQNISGSESYCDYTESFFTLSNTKSLEVSVAESASALNYYLYVDLNNDGSFVPLFNKEGLPAVSSELVSYSYYNGKDSDGNSVDVSNKMLPLVTLPDALPYGVYRARIVGDVNNILPQGTIDLPERGGVVVDFLLNIVDGNCSLKLYTTNGTILGGGNTALPLNITPLATALDIKLLPSVPGFAADEVVVRYGHALEGEQFVNGNKQWAEERFDVSSDALTIPCEFTAGDVAVFADFKPVADSEWQLVFSDEFNAEDYSQPLDEKWMRCQRYGATWNRWLSNSEEVIYIKDGNLVARAIPNPDTASDPVPMITGGIKSNNRFGFTYGYVEARILTGSWIGNFPAFWLMPEDQSAGWPDCGEIDVWETIDTEQRSYHTVHSNWTYDLGQTGNPRSSFNVAVNNDRYHTYGLMWDETSLVWYVDGKEVGRYEKSSNQSMLSQGQWPFDKHFHIILNQSVGNGAWAKDADVTHTYETLFDWVRVYQKPGMLNTDGTVGVVGVDEERQVDVRIVEGGVRVAADAPANVEVYDLAGRKVAETYVRDVLFIPLAQGAYIIENCKVFVK